MTPAAIVSLLLEVSWRSVLVAVLVGGVLRLWRVKGGAVRHAAWSAVMVAMLLMPVLMAVAPEWQMPVRIPVMRAASAPDAIPEPSPRPDDPPLSSSRTVGAVPTEATAGGPDPVAMPAISIEAVRASTGGGRDWPQVAMLIWLVGVVVNIAVMIVGWRMARRLVRGARTSEIDPRVLESPAVSAPCAVGVWHVSVVVPRVWRTWSRAGRDAVLQHEFAHVRRRDLFVAFLTRLNRAVFWFNPIAWWLERRIAVAAEQACDEAVLLSGQDPQRYAAVLVEMAGALRSGGGRVAWQSIGMAEGGDLESRVDRVLTGDVPRLSRWRAAGVSSMSAAALFLAVACQQAPVPLQPNPEVTEEMRAYQAREAKWKADRSLTVEQAAALARTFKETHDLAAARSLLTFYMDRGQVLMGWNEMVAARRPLLLTLIELRPESGMTRWPLEPRFDPDGWAAAKALWLAHVAKPDVTAQVLGNAATFFQGAEPERSEELLRRAIAIDPDGPQPRVRGEVYVPSWMSRLGSLYAAAIVGARDGNTYSSLRELDRAYANGPFAHHARQTLDATTDARLLAAAGQWVLTTVIANRSADDLSQVLGFDVVSLGRGYLERARTIDPSLRASATLLSQFDQRRRREQLVESLEAQLGRNLREATPDKVAALPVDVRSALLPRLAYDALTAAQMNDPAGPAKKRADARAYADAALALADAAPEASSADGLRLAAHLVHGALAMHDGDRRAAVQHLKLATQVAGSTRHGLPEWVGHHGLTNRLLDEGERETVAAFYDALALQDSEEYSFTYTKAAAAIRNGLMPNAYQRMLARSGRLVIAN